MGRGGMGFLKFDRCLQILLISNDRSIVHFCRRGPLKWEFMTLKGMLFLKISKEFNSFTKAITLIFLWKQPPP